MNSKTGIFGGTFDPPHKGHLMIARNILEAGILDRVIFVPAPKPPHKPALPSADFRFRLEMLRIMLNDMNRMEISEVEFRRPGEFSYSYDTLIEMSGLYHDSEIVLIIGTDSLLQLHTWHKATKIIETWKVLSYPRKGVNVSISELEKFWPKETASKLFSNVLMMPECAISSTLVRKKIRFGENVDHLIEKNVLEYIVRNRLYSSANCKSQNQSRLNKL